jgi:ATP-binding cassette subfamily B multidrug efflux pump
MRPDEALSAVDTQTEALILAGIRRYLCSRTAFVISHRVTAVMHADQILVLDGGSIAERGTHEDLLVRGGVYATLLRRQLLERVPRPSRFNEQNESLS